MKTTLALRKDSRFFSTYTRSRMEPASRTRINVAQPSAATNIGKAPLNCFMGYDVMAHSRFIIVFLFSITMEDMKPGGTISAADSSQGVFLPRILRVRCDGEPSVYLRLGKPFDKLRAGKFATRS